MLKEIELCQLSDHPLLLLLSRFSCVRLCATPQTVAHQAPLSLGFSRQEHWSGWPFPSPVHESEKGKVKSLSRARLLVTPQTAAYQAPLSMGFSRQEYWSGVPLPSPLSSFTFHKNHRKLLCCCEHPKWQPVLEFHMQDCLLDLFSLAAVWKQLQFGLYMVKICCRIYLL